MLGPAEDACQAFAAWQAATEAAGEEANTDKCKAFSPAFVGPLRLPAGVERVPPAAGLKILGHPFGSAAFCRSFFARKAAKTGVLCGHVCALARYSGQFSLQSAYLLLRYCAEPRVAHLLRAAPPHLIKQAAAAHDQSILACLNSILGLGNLLRLDLSAEETADSPPEWVVAAALAVQQAGLPIREGGLGLRSAVAVSDPAYAGGWARTTAFLHQQEVAEACKLPAELRGAAVSQSLAAARHPHCSAVRGAWGRVRAEYECTKFST